MKVQNVELQNDAHWFLNVLSVASVTSRWPGCQL